MVGSAVVIPRQNISEDLCSVSSLLPSIPVKTIKYWQINSMLIIVYLELSTFDHHCKFMVCMTTIHELDITLCVLLYQF